MVNLIQRTEVWTFTWQGWLGILVALSLGIVGSLRWIYPFLTVSHPIPAAKVAIVEGWLPDDILKALIPDLTQYDLVLTTGFPVLYGRYLSGYDTFAEVAADTLILFGLSPDRVIPVAHGSVRRDRTLACAFAIRDWLAQSNPDVQAVNLYSLGPHARRSWLLFRKALDPIQVGVVSAQPQDYEPDQWWQTSSGTRSVLAETISYLYAVLVSWTR